MESQSPLEKSIKESGLCVGPVKHLLIGNIVDFAMPNTNGVS